jgi:hypothetical protein
MYHKTNTLRTSSSTLITSSPYSPDSARGMKSKTPSIEKNYTSNFIEAQKKENINIEKKEKVVKKHISFSEIKILVLDIQLLKIL